jgi:hypothetical protein
MRAPMLSAITLIAILQAERPAAMDQEYHKAGAWDRGACDEFNTIVIRVAHALYPPDGKQHEARADFIANCIMGETK